MYKYSGKYLELGSEAKENDSFLESLDLLDFRDDLNYK